MSPSIAPPVAPVIQPMTPPAVAPVTPPLGPEASKPMTIDFPRPAAAEVRPAVPTDRAATTSFDVDLHEVKTGDSYESICREFYSDVKYAPALRTFNSNRALQAKDRVEVPPIHVLKPSSAITLPSGEQGLVVSDGERRAAVAQFMRG